MPKLKHWIPAIATILAVIIAGVIQYVGTQAAIKSQAEIEQLSEMAAELFQGWPNRRAEGRQLMAQAQAKAAIYGDAGVIRAFVRLQTENEPFDSAMVDLIIEIRRQAETPSVGRQNLTALVSSASD